MNNISLFLGESAALGAAFLWAASSVVYTRLGQSLPPILLNSLKGVMAIAFLLLTLLILQPSLGDFTVLGVTVLAISGILGIGIGDTAYFTALRYLGARRTLLLETLSPPISAIIAMIFLGETLNLQEWGGICLTLIGVAWVITERTSQTGVNPLQWKQGILWGILAAICQASGAVLSRYALVLSNMSPLWSTLIRLIAGTFLAFVLWLTVYQFKAKTQVSLSYRLFSVISLTAFGSTYLGIWLQQISLKFAPTGISQTLSATSPLFILPIAYFFGEKISKRSIVGVLIALLGIGVLFLAE